MPCFPPDLIKFSDNAWFHKCILDLKAPPVLAIIGVAFLNDNKMFSFLYYK